MSARLGGLVLLALACSPSSPAGPTTSALPPGVVAKVGAELVSASTVGRIAERQGLPARRSLELALSDAVFAHHARAQLPAASVSATERAAAARALLETLASQLKAGPEPTPAELEDLRRERWAELDRPESVRTSHAVVLVDKPERNAAALRVAEKLAAALASVTSGDELIRVAEAFPNEGLQIRAEQLPYVTADGRVLLPTESGFAAQRGSYDLDFAKAANAIPQVGRLSPVVKSSFGYHIIRLEERLPAASTPAAELPALLGPQALARRGSKQRRELVERLRAAAAVQIERASDDLTAKVKVTP